MQRQEAKTLALQALGWLVADESLLPVFLGSTGASLSDVRERASDAEFLGAVLDFICMDDAWVTAFSTAQGHPPETLLRARAALPGGDLPHWT